MTIMHNRLQFAPTGAKVPAYRAYPVAEWDLLERDVPARKTGPVRTLNVSTGANPEVRMQAPDIGQREKSQFETRREKRESLLVGIGLGIALILGSALGGVFSPEQPGERLPTEAELAFYAQY